MVGGSPAARPTSRCAIAKRVTESISSRTFSPWSRKYSAIAVAVNAARIRSSGGLSDVETTTTERARPSAPEVVVEEAAHFAAALTDQAQHDHVGRGAARQHAEQRALAHAAAAEEADALPATARQQPVDGAHARTDRRLDGLAVERVQRARLQRVAVRPGRSG